MHRAIVAAIGGIVIVSVSPTLDTHHVVLLSVLALLAAVLALWLRRRWLLVTLSLLMGATWAAAYGVNLLQHLLAPALEGSPVWVTGTVAGLPEQTTLRGEPRVRFQLAISDARCADHPDSCAPFPRRLRLSWRNPPAVIPGQRWRLQVTLKRPHGLMNPGGFDYQTWLIRRGIGATGYVVDGAANRLLGSARVSVDRWRWQLSRFLDQRLRGCAQRPLLKALLIADDRAIDPALWQLVRRQGVVHLLVISGLHIGLVALLVYRLLRLASLLTPLRAQADRLAALGAMAAAGLYCLAAGASLPTRRALIMLMVFMGQQLLRRQPAVVPALLLALLICLLCDPLAAVSASLWLSFGAVVLLALGMHGRIGRGGIAPAALRGQWPVFVGMVPLLVIAFGQFSWLAPGINLVAIPLFSLLVVPLALVGLALAAWAPLLAGWCWAGSDRLLDVGVRGLAWLDRALPVTVSWPPTAPLALQVAAVIGALVLVAPRGLPLKGPAALCLLALLVWQPPKPDPGALDFTVLDVGQGLSVVVETAGHVLVYDVGARYPLADGRAFSLARVALVPYLRSRGINAVDTLVLSHADNDHAGGWPELLEAMPVGTVLTGEPLPQLPSTPCTAVPGWQWEGVRFQWLALAADAPGETGNNRSCVLLIETGAVRFLLPGDIERDAEYRLVRRYAEQLRASVLVAPHHGSRSSSSWALLKQVRPRHVIFPVGYRNAFGHPHPSVVARYRRFGCRLHDTSHSGAVQFRVRDHKLLSPTHYRALHRRYWL